MQDLPVLRVVVADDHPVYREGIVHALGRCDDIDVVGECATGDEALETIAALQPDVAVVDQRMPGLSTARVIEDLAQRGTTTRVLVISAFTDGEGVRDVLRAGASGFVAKSATRDAICAAVRRVGQGETVLGEDVQAAVVEQLRAAPRTLLSERERQVLELLAEGLTSGQIAERLILGQATVKTHLAHLYDKLGVSDRAAAVAEAMRRGLLR
jgi:two-component system nitrate/nitrite response regulator NarL